MPPLPVLQPPPRLGGRGGFCGRSWCRREFRVSAGGVQGKGSRRRGPSCLSCHDSSMTELLLYHAWTETRWEKHSTGRHHCVDHSDTTFSQMLVTNMLANVWIFPRGRIFMLIKIMTLRWGHSMCPTLVKSAAVINTLRDTTVETDSAGKFMFAATQHPTYSKFITLRNVCHHFSAC